MGKTDHQVNIYLGTGEFVYAKVADTVNMSALARRSIQQDALRQGVDLDELEQTVTELVESSDASGPGPEKYESVYDVIKHNQNLTDLLKKHNV